MSLLPRLARHVVVARYTAARVSSSLRRDVTTTYGRLHPVAALRLFDNKQSTCVSQVRFFSNHDNNDDDKKSKQQQDITKSFDTTSSTTEDFFGKNYDDGPDKLGPTLPPNYVRDATTGRLTGQVRSELTAEQQKLLSADPLQQDSILADRIQRHWQAQGEKDDDDSSSSNSNNANILTRLGQRVRKAHRDLNVLGRSPAAQAAAAKAAATASLHEHDDTEATTQRLTPQEMQEFKVYMKKHHKVDLQDDDMPVTDPTPGVATTSTTRSSSTSFPAADTDWAIQWRSEQAQRQMDDLLDDNPYADIMPQDLSTSPLVNRKQAKPLPREILSHNNVALLQSFLTETGQIKARVQTRLGARDQRKVAKLVKRARALGLIPYQGPFKVEQHGWVHDPTLQQARPWEKEMERRGLTLRKTQQQQQQQASSSSSLSSRSSITSDNQS